MHLREYFKLRIYRRQARPLDKYFGKWPFRRVWGVQELMSVLFSICNLGVRVACAQRVCRCRVHQATCCRLDGVGQCSLNPNSSLRSLQSLPATAGKSALLGHGTSGGCSTAAERCEPWPRHH